MPVAMLSSRPQTSCVEFASPVQLEWLTLSYGLDAHPAIQSRRCRRRQPLELQHLMMLPLISLPRVAHSRVVHGMERMEETFPPLKILPLGAPPKSPAWCRVLSAACPLRGRPPGTPPGRVYRVPWKPLDKTSDLDHIYPHIVCHRPVRRATI